MSHLVVFGLVSAGIAVTTIVWLIRTRRVQERYALLWLLALLILVVFGVWESALVALARVTGIAYAPNALILLVLAFVLAALLQAAVMLTRLSTQNQRLAQRLALLDERVREVEGDGAGPQAGPIEGRGSIGPSAERTRPSVPREEPPHAPGRAAAHSDQ